MATISTALALLLFSQAPVQDGPDRRVQAIAPFIDNDVFAILQLDLTQGELPGLARRVVGDSPAGLFANLKSGLQWSESLRKAGAKEVYFVFSVADLPGPPFVVVPLVDGADAAGIERLFQGDGTGPRLFGLHRFEKLHNAAVARSQVALERVRVAAAVARPELSAAFAAAGAGRIAARLLILPSVELRRVLEETVPSFPAELGGGPITDLTRGMMWAASGLEVEPGPSLRLIVEAKDPVAAKALERLVLTGIDFLARSPDLQR